MTAWIVLVVLTLPGGAQTKLVEEWISASSASVCQAYADKLADVQRAKAADAVRRLGATVVGACLHQGALT